MNTEINYLYIFTEIDRGSYEQAFYRSVSHLRFNHKSRNVGHCVPNS